MAAVESAQFQQRERKLDAVRFLRAMILSASTEYGGRQADVMRLYFEAGAPRVARASFYDWFGPKLEAAMEQVSARAIEQAQSLPLDLPGILGIVKDWRIVDSETVKLPDELKDLYPGTGDFAAIKVHKVLSVGVGTTIGYHFSPACEHDSPHLVLDETWRGYGLLVDLGYASVGRLRECQEHGVSIVIRLKENWQPRVQRITRGEVAATFTPGTDLDVLLEKEVLRLNGRVVDAEVTVGRGTQAVMLRLVGVPTPTGRYNFYLTNLPGKIGPRQVATLYRVRWEIESNNKIDKSCHRLDAIDAKKPEAVRALLHASLVASIVVCIIGHKVQIEERPRRRGTERRTPPIHCQQLARAIGSAATSLAAAMDLKGAAARVEWNRLLDLLLFMGRDPNWRNRPSVLDQLRGWRTSPGRRKRSTEKTRANS